MLELILLICCFNSTISLNTFATKRVSVSSVSVCTDASFVTIESAISTSDVYTAGPNTFDKHDEIFDALVSICFGLGSIGLGSIGLGLAISILDFSLFSTVSVMLGFSFTHSYGIMLPSSVVI